MTLDYFYGQSGELFAYFRIPKALFQDSRFRQLSTDARTLYGILLDRMGLSAKNGWLDEQGRVYIIYTVREVQESLCCAEHKAVKLFRELEQANLIERKRRGLGRPSLIYVKNFSSGLPKAQVQTCANSNSCAAENAVQVQPKPQSNKTDKNKTERKNPFLPDESDREQLEDYFYQAWTASSSYWICSEQKCPAQEEIGQQVHARRSGTDAYRAPWKIICIRTAFKEYKTYGADLYKEALTMLARGWEGDPDSLRSGILRGMVRFVALYQGEYDPERLVKRLQTIHPMTLVRDEKAMSGTVSYKYMMLILRTYNGSSRRFNLPIKQ